MDLTTVVEHGRPWDFDGVRMRNHACRRVMQEQPMLRIGSVFCGPWSSIMELNYCKMTPADRDWMIERARKHLTFFMRSLYRLQRREGRYFLHAHPWSARSWKEESMININRYAQADVRLIHQCQY